MKLYTPNCEVTEGMALPDNVRRVALVIEYDGAEFRGFQKQTSTELTVQAQLERALSFVAAHAVTLVCAGRTDAGVHAVGQVVHFDTSSVRPTKAWVQGVNNRLPASVRVLFAQELGMGFHARFRALSRTYQYFLCAAPVRPAIMHRNITWVGTPVNVKKMHEQAQSLVGEHDFSSFRSSQCQAKSPCRNLMHISVTERGRFVVFELTANAFLHHMVRNIVGALLVAGRDRSAQGAMAEWLALKDRTRAPATAAPYGLYLTKVQYPPSFAPSFTPPGPPFFG